MATVGETTRPGYVYDSATDVWIPVGIGPHSHTPAAIGAISSSVVTTKGDLIVATGSGTVVRQGVGADGSYLVADSTQADGVTWAGPSTMAGRNAVLNSNFSVWQRGTSFTIALNTITYTSDRWSFYRNATGATVTRQVTNDTTNLPFIQYCMRVARDSGNTSTQQLQLAQGFETVNSIPFVNKSVVLSFYARSGANYSASSGALTVQLIGGTGTDQSAFAYTGTTAPINTTATLTTTWQRFTFTGTIGSTVTEIAPRFFFDPTGTAGAADYYEVTGVQLEVGSVATPYAPNGATYQAELAACQRYYWRFTGPNAYSVYAMGAGTGTTGGYAEIDYPVTMRTVPSSIDFANLGSQNINTALVISAITALTLDQVSTKHASCAFAVASGSISGTPVRLLNNNNAAGYVGMSAEL
jgi:hypothetical protein